MNLLVAGGAGFVGSNFIHYILKKYPGYKIINLDKENPDNLQDIGENSRYAFIKGDMRNKALADKLAGRKPDAIVNFANSISGTRALLEAAKKYNIGCYFQASTSRVYGFANCGSFTEESRLEPGSPNSALKAGADLLVMAYYRKFSLPVLITRSSDNYGPCQNSNLIHIFITNLLQEKKIPVYRDGIYARDWIYVLDHCSAIDCVLRHGKAGEIYNAGSGSEKTDLEAAKLLLNLLDKDENYIEYIEGGLCRHGHSDCRYSLDSTKLRRLGWRPKYMFEQAISDTLDWYISNAEKSRNITKHSIV